MNEDESPGRGKIMLAGGCLMILLVAGGLIYLSARVEKHEDTAKAEMAAKISAAAAKEREAAIAAKQVLVGMKRDEVERAWGKPEKINRTSSGAGVREQWVYETGFYVYFGNETVTSVER